MIFVDSGAWFASVVEDDVDHVAAKNWFDKNFENLLLTDYIIDETLTLLRSRGAESKALELGKLFFETKDVFVHYLSETEIKETWNIFKQYSDKGWSFTDCSSKHICEKLQITKTVSFDKHFRQFGSLIVLP
ncbi:MAG: type II toxin-antitoxin system VapC family toxin [Blastocatellia bacterium]